MEIRTPLQIITVRDKSNPDSDSYIEMLRLAFEGESTNTSTNGYLADSIDLSIRVLDLDQPPETTHDTKRLLNGARYTILVVIDNSTHSKKKKNCRALDKEKSIANLKKNIKTSNRLRIDPVLEIKLPGPVAEGDIQTGQSDPDGIEPSLLPVALALNSLNCARNLLRHKIYRTKSRRNQRLKLFLSHAKIDGVPIALSLLGLMRRLSRNANNSTNDEDYFYDVEHIKPGDLWRNVLENNAKNSVLIALRTDEYEKRYWCRQEYLWAESNGMPVLVVDLRSGQYYDSARLPFDTAPLVKVHDGNLVRVILHAMAYDLRMLRYQALLNGFSSQYKYIVLPHKPSVYSINGAVSTLEKDASKTEKPGRIVYPNPPLPADYASSIKPILKENCELLSIDQLMGDL